MSRSTRRACVGEREYKPGGKSVLNFLYVGQRSLEGDKIT